LARDRSFKISKLPSGTQEALIQQQVEKHAKVEKIVVFPERSEAVVELQNAAVRRLSFAVDASD